jgi:glycosyltransferase involved in cell wall biosynthesis
MFNLANSTAISVVIPLYNKRTDVERAIGCALGQTHPPAEVIVVDDGSTDGGADIVEAIADPRVRLTRQANAGVSAARNHGISLASSELFAFLDADDEWMPDHLEAICRLRQMFPQCHVFATGYVFRQKAPAQDRHPIFRGLPPAPWEGVLEDYFGLAASSDPPLWSSAVAATRKALDSVGGFPVGVPQGEDLLTWARMAVKYPVAFTTHVSAVFWQAHFDAAMPTRRPAEVDEVAPELVKLLDQTDKRTRVSLQRYIGLWHYSGFGNRLAAYRLMAAMPEWLARPLAGATRRARRHYRAIAPHTDKCRQWFDQAAKNHCHPRQ